jgi:hypothetical protein
MLPSDTDNQAPAVREKFVRKRAGFLAIAGSLALAAFARAGDDDLIARARDALDEGKSRDALALVEKALAQKPDDAALLALRGEARLDLGRSQDARADLERAAKNPEQKKKVAGIRARIEFLYGNDAAAHKLLEDAPADDADLLTLPLLMTGPFAEGLGEIASITSGRSTNGHYVVYSDVGLTEDVLAKAKGDRATGSALTKAAGVTEGGKILDVLYKAYDAVFPFEKDARLISRVYIFASREDFLTFSQALGEDMDDAVGFYSPGTRILAIDAQDDPEGKETFSEDTRDTIFHEGFHQFVRFHAPGLPTWLDEGLAEYFGPSKILASGKLETGVVKKTAGEGKTTRLQDIREALKDGTALPLAKFVQLDDDTFSDEKQVLTNYAQAWSLIHFLVSTEHRALVIDYFRLIRAGKTPEQAHAETFGKTDMAALEKQWRKYVEGL